MKRFKASLPCGSWSKEELVEDENGAFVKYEDAMLEHEKFISAIQKAKDMSQVRRVLMQFGYGLGVD